MQELDNLWREDPRKAMQTELMTALNWKDQVEAQVDDQIDAAATKYKDFNDHQSEVRRYIRRLPVEQRAKPGVIEAAYFMVKGRNADSFAKAEAERLLKKAQAGDGTQTINAGASSGGGDGTNNAGSLTPEQKAAAAAMGVSEAEYAKYMKR
jgi:phage I-like protein